MSVKLSCHMDVNGVLDTDHIHITPHLLSFCFIYIFLIILDIMENKEDYKDAYAGKGLQK